MGRGRGDVRPNVSRPHGFSVDDAFRIECSDTLLEVPFDGRVHRQVRRAAVEPPDRPFLRLSVECTERDAVGISLRPEEDLFLDVRRSVHQRTVGRGAIEFLPRSVGALDAVMDAPLAELEIKIVHAWRIALGRPRRPCGLLRRGRRDSSGRSEDDPEHVVKSLHADRTCR